MVDSTQTAVRPVLFAFALAFVFVCLCGSCRSNGTNHFRSSWNPAYDGAGKDDKGSEVDSDSTDTGSHGDSSDGVGASGYIANEIIVALKEGARESDAVVVASELDGVVAEWIPELNVALVRIGITEEKMPSGTDCNGRRFVSGLYTGRSGELNRRISQAQSNPLVRYAEPHYYGCAATTPVTPDDTRYAEQYYIKGTHVDDVWNLSTGSPEITIAIIDSGVDYDHPEFVGRIHPAGKDFVSPPHDDDPGLRGDGGATPGNGIDDDGDNFTDDGAQHGSRTAGVSSAMGNNGEGIAGVNWQSRILSLRVDSLVGEIHGWLTIDCVRAMMYTLKFPEVKIINISAVYPRTQQILRDATRVCYESGKVVVAAAGNATEDTPELSAPAYYPECIAVGGTSGISSLWVEAGVGTNYGSFIDILAPATDIMTVNSDGETRTYAAVDGTSLAAPLVSGIAAMIVAAHPDYTPDDVASALAVGAVNFDAKYPDKAGKLGAGLINCYSAFQAPPQIDLAIQYSRSDGLTHFELKLNRKLDPVSATNVEHYTLSPSSYIYRAVLLSDGQTVRLETNPLAVGGYYTVSINALTTSDGETQYPDVQETSFRVVAASFNAASSDFGAVATATSEFDESHLADKAIDPNTLSYWYAEIPQDGFVDLAVRLPQMEWINSITVAGRKQPLSESDYRQILQVYAVPAYGTSYPILEETYSPIIDPEIMTDSKLTILGDRLVQINFEPVKTENLVLRFLDGNDFKLDSDGESNGVSIRWIQARREMSDDDTYAPVVYRITPDSAPLGATIEFTGEKFGTGDAASRILFGDIEAITLLWTDKRILALVPYNPLSLPVVVPVPQPTITDIVQGEPVPDPGIIDPVIPPFENATSGNVTVIRGEYTSNRLYFDLATS